MPTVMITGVPSVGKSTVLKHLAEKGPYTIINTGTKLFELAQERGLVEQRDQLRALPAATLAGLRIEVAARMSNEGLVLVDSHLTVKGRNGLMCVLSAGVLDRMPLTAIILLEADPGAIVARRSGDPSRRRDADDECETQRHQEHNRAAAWAIAATREISILCLDNDDPAATADAIASHLEDIR